MKFNLLGMGALLSLVFAGHSAHAIGFTYGDPTNIKAPAMWSSSPYAVVAVRKSDGNLYTKTVEPSLGASWNLLGKPAIGTSSGPATVFANNVAYYVVRGTDGLIYESHGGAWSNAMGAPAGGAGTSPAIAALAWGPIYVAVLDNNNSPWYRQMNSNGTPATPWTKAGVNSLQGVPGIAINSSVTPHMFALDASQNTIRARCGFGGGCFNPWTNYGPGLGNSGTNAVNYHTDAGTNNISTVLLGLDNKPWVSTSTDDGASFGGFTSLGGAVADSSPAMAWFSPAQRLLVSVHHSDGYYLYNYTLGAWTAIGSP